MAHTHTYIHTDIQDCGQTWLGTKKQQHDSMTAWQHGSMAGQTAKCFQRLERVSWMLLYKKKPKKQHACVAPKRILAAANRPCWIAKQYLHCIALHCAYSVSPTKIGCWAREQRTALTRGGRGWEGGWVGIYFMSGSSLSIPVSCCIPSQHITSCSIFHLLVVASGGLLPPAASRTLAGTLPLASACSRLSCGWAQQRQRLRPCRPAPSAALAPAAPRLPSQH